MISGFVSASYKAQINKCLIVSNLQFKHLFYQTLSLMLQ